MNISMFDPIEDLPLSEKERKEIDDILRRRGYNFDYRNPIRVITTTPRKFSYENEED